MFEDARLRFLVDVAGNPPPGAAIMVVNLSIDYVAQTHYPDPIVFHGAVTRVGRSSVETLQLAVQGDGAVALARTVFVITDGKHPLPVPPEAAAILAALSLRA